jgi:hypothetical protein
MGLVTAFRRLNPSRTSFATPRTACFGVCEREEPAIGQHVARRRSAAQEPYVFQEQRPCAEPRGADRRSNTRRTPAHHGHVIGLSVFHLHPRTYVWFLYVRHGFHHLAPIFIQAMCPHRLPELKVGAKDVTVQYIG